MKICHVITRMVVGGAQENTLFTCQGLLEHGHEVTLVTGPSPGPEGELLSKTCPKGLDVIQVDDLVRQLSPLRDWRAYKELRAIFRQKAFDVVHTHASKAGILGRLAADKENVPLVVHTVHGQAFFKGQNPILNRAYILAERMAARHCDKIYAVAQAMIDQCVEARVASSNKYKVVYSGMDLDAFVNATPSEELRESLGIPKGVPVIGTIARLFPLKGHDKIIEAAPEILREEPETRFLFIGDGILHKKLEERIAAAGMSRNFVFTGLVPPDQVCRYTPLMTVLAHLSLREGLPRAAVQALASAVPVVAYPLDGTPEVVLDGQTGVLCPVGDSHAFAQAVLKLLRTPALRQEMGSRGRELVKLNFDWRLMAEILENEYQKGLAIKKSAL